MSNLSMAQGNPGGSYTSATGCGKKLSTHRVVGVVEHEDIVTTRAYIELAFKNRREVERASSGWQFWCGICITTFLAGMQSTFGSVGRFLSPGQVKAIVWATCAISFLAMLWRLLRAFWDKDKLTCERFIEEITRHQKA